MSSQACSSCTTISDGQPTTAQVTKALETSWIPLLGAPHRVYTEDDRVFTSDSWAKFCARYNIELQLSAASAANQHGMIEQVHHNKRHAIVAAWATAPNDVPLQSALVEIGAAHNELSKHHSGVTPNMLAFGQTRRDLPDFGGGLNAPHPAVAQTLRDTDPRFVQVSQLRQAAREAHIRADSEARVARAGYHKSRGTHGPFQPGERE